MKKISIFLSLFLGLSLLLAACASNANENNGSQAATSVAGTGETAAAPVGTAAAGAATAAVGAGQTAEAPTNTPFVTPLAPSTVVPPSAILTGTPSALGTAVLPATGTINKYLLSSLLNAEVKSPDGQSLGEVENVVVNLNNEKIDYAVLSTGGFLGIGTKRLPIPWSDLQVNATNNDNQEVLVYTGDLNALKTAPAFNSQNEQDDLNNPNWDSELNTYWERLTGQNVGTAVPSTAILTTPSASATMTSTLASNNVVLAKTLIGGEVNDKQGMSVGTIQNLVITDFKTGKVRYAIIKTSSNMNLNENDIIVPVSMLHSNTMNNGEGEHFTINANLNAIKKAPNFNPDNLPDFTAQNWYNAIKSYWNSLINQ